MALGLWLGWAVSVGAFTDPPLLDNFNRADQGPPPSANWTSAINPAQNPRLCVVGSALRRCTTPTGTLASAWWNAASFGPDMAVAFRLSDAVSASGHWLELFVRLLGPGTSGADGYTCEFRPDNDLVFISRWTNTLGIGLVGPVVATMDTGDEIACEVIGSTITAYINRGSGWVAAASASDTTYSSTGFVGVAISTTGYGLDDFRAGTIAAGVTTRRGVPLWAD